MYFFREVNNQILNKIIGGSQCPESWLNVTGLIAQEAPDYSIIDEWLLEKPTEVDCKYLLEIFEQRYDSWPTTFCSQYKTTEWHPRLGGGVIADAFLDRIVHNCKNDLFW